MSIVSNPKTTNPMAYYMISLLILIGSVAAAAATRIWVLTALPIGFLFGFFIQKGDLCGASAFSEVLLLKDWRKIYGLWVCIVVSMAGFALLDLLGWITLTPKPFLWMNCLVGGAIFGAGMVLAGGCVSGCMFKAATGNINSMAGLIGISIGIAIVEYGPLSFVHRYMTQFIIKTRDGSVFSLPALTGLPFGWLALGFALLTLVVFGLNRRPQKPTQDLEQKRSWEEIVFRRSWKPWVAGLAIGLLGIPAYLSSAASGRNYPLGVTHGVLQAQLLLTDQHFNHVWKSKSSAAQPTTSSNPPASSQTQKPPSSEKTIVWWLVALILSYMMGAFVSGRLSGEARLFPKPPDQTVIAFFGGVLVGIGAAFATGCVIGNILSGWALMSVGMFVFGIVVVLANWITTYFYLMGGTFFEMFALLSKPSSNRSRNQ